MFPYIIAEGTHTGSYCRKNTTDHLSNLFIYKRRKRAKWGVILEIMFSVSVVDDQIALYIHENVFMET